MNIYAAVQRDDGRWEFCTGTTASGPAPTGYCVSQRSWPESLGWLMEIVGGKERRLAARHHADGHGTAEEARDCYRQFLLDTAAELNGDAYRNGKPADDPDGQFMRAQCGWPSCMVRTTGNGQVGHDFHVPLCSEHRSIDNLSTVFRQRFSVDRVSSW